ncbi:MAG: hypothetical protein Phog2KO_44870 [Phototrophicaceae bacterium]
MSALQTIFDKYVELRLNGQELESVYADLQSEVLAKLNKEERSQLSGDCESWERNRTQVNLSEAQREALKRTALTNITMKIVFCQNCDSPNADGFIRCQVCNEPLAVEVAQARTTTGITGQGRGSLYERDSQLILKIASSNEQLKIQPQISPTGLKIGRSSGNFSADVDLNPFEGGSYGVSRSHATIRFDRDNHRLIIIDAGSTNGTFVNGIKLPPNMESTISDGDELKLGKMCFRVKIK